MKLVDLSVHLPVCLSVYTNWQRYAFQRASLSSYNYSCLAIIRENHYITYALKTHKNDSPLFPHSETIHIHKQNN